MDLQKRLRLAAGAAGTSFALFILIGGADAATLTVGAGRMYKNPAAAAAAAHAGDTIQIYPGTYGGADFTKPNLTIVGMGSVVITGGQVLQKGLFVIDGKNITIRNITFKGAKSAAGNGAGIRMDKTGLSVINSRFLSNQNGILTANDPTMTLSVTGSTFDGNGACSGSCAHAIYAGHIASLTVTNSTFTNTHAGHHIKSRANATTITGNTISDGPNGNSSYLIDMPNGGAVTITGNTLEKGPKSANYSVAISLGEEGASNPAGAMLIANNRFTNDGRPTTFVMNRTGNAHLLLSNNLVSGNKTTLLKGQGSISGPAAANVAPDSSGGSPMLFAAMNGDPVSVPEVPSILLLLAAGLLRMVAVWNGRKKNVST